MNLTEKAKIAESLGVGIIANANLQDVIFVERAQADFQHKRAAKWTARKGNKTISLDRTGIDALGIDLYSGKGIENFDSFEADADSYEIIDEQTSYNVKTNVGIDFVHTQTYGTSPSGNGLNYIALSNDTLTETATSTTLSTEIAANGLSRAQGVVAHTGGTTTTTVSKTFTCTTTSQAAQKAALFTASSSGTMNHVLAFTQRTLQVTDQLVVTFTLTIS